MYSVSQDYLDALDAPIQTYRLTGTVGAVPFTEDNIISLTIDNQVSEGSEVKLGSVYVGELNAVFSGLTIARGSWVGKVITLSEGLLTDADLDTYEDVPLGVFTIAEAKHTLEGVEVVAYDAMASFDKTFSLDQTNGAAFSLLSLSCTECGVTLGNTQAQIEALPNGNTTLYLYSGNDIETWRDFISWIAQTTCTVATIGRDGKLYLRRYSVTSAASIDEQHRFSGCAFSDFTVKYTATICTVPEENLARYASVTPDDGLTYTLGTNPFMQGSDGETLQQNLTNAFSLVQLVPFSAQMLGGAIYDLCDCLTFTGGVAAGAVVGVMGYSYTYNGGYKVEGYGSNPALADAKSKADKDISGIVSQMDLDKPRIFAYTNASAITISDGETATVAYLHVVAKKMTRFVLQLEVNHTAETTETETASTYTNNDLNITGKIYINDVLQDFAPVEVEQDGKQGYSLTFTEQVPVQGMEVRVDLTCAGGNISVAIGDVQAYLMGPGFDDYRIESITVASLPNNLFPYGFVNFDGLVINGVFNDGSQSDVTDDCVITPSEGTAIPGDAVKVSMSANYNNGQFVEDFDAPVNDLFTFLRENQGTLFTTQYADHVFIKNGDDIFAIKESSAVNGNIRTFTLAYVQMAFDADHRPTTPSVKSNWQTAFTGSPTPTARYFRDGSKEYVLGSDASDVRYFDFDDLTNGTITATLHDDPRHSGRTLNSVKMNRDPYVLDGYVIYPWVYIYASDANGKGGYAYSVYSTGIDTYVRQEASTADMPLLENLVVNTEGNFEFVLNNDGTVTVNGLSFDTVNFLTRTELVTIDPGFTNASSITPKPIAGREDFVILYGSDGSMILFNCASLTFKAVTMPPNMTQITNLDEIRYISSEGVYLYFWKDSSLQYSGRIPIMYFSKDFETWHRGGTLLPVGELVTCGDSWGTNLVEDGEYIIGSCYNTNYDQIGFAAHIDADLGA